MSQTPFIHITLTDSGNPADIAKTRNSIEAQTFRDFEVSILPSGTTDHASTAHEYGMMLPAGATLHPSFLERAAKALTDAPETDILTFDTAHTDADYWIQRHYAVVDNTATALCRLLLDGMYFPCRCLWRSSLNPDISDAGIIFGAKLLCRRPVIKSLGGELSVILPDNPSDATRFSDIDTAQAILSPAFGNDTEWWCDSLRAIICARRPNTLSDDTIRQEMTAILDKGTWRRALKLRLIYFVAGHSSHENAVTAAKWLYKPTVENTGGIG